MRIGFIEVSPEDLGFEAYTITMHGQLYVHTLTRHGIPLIVVTISEQLTLYDIQYARTATLDYPTKPFKIMLRLLKEQQEELLERIAKTEGGLAPCDVIAYIADVAGLLAFSLQRRGIEAMIPVECSGIRASLERIRRWIETAEKPAPSLGNTVYIDIAKEAYELLRISVDFLRLYRVHGCYVA